MSSYLNECAASHQIDQTTNKMVKKTNKLRTAIGIALVKGTARNNWKSFLDFITKPPFSIDEGLLSDDKKKVALSTYMNIANKVQVKIPCNFEQVASEHCWVIPDQGMVNDQRLLEAANATTTGRTGRPPANNEKREIEARILATEAKILVIKGARTNDDTLLQNIPLIIDL